MIDFNMPPEHRLDDWQMFRTSLANNDDITQLEDVAKYWSMVPINNWYLDENDPKSWPSPWELIHDGDFCPTTVSYLMQETLKLSDSSKWENSRFSLKFIKDLEHDKMQVVLVVDNTWVLNYTWSKVENWKNIEQHITILNTISK